MDSVKIRELEEKTTLEPTDVVVIEDYDGTKVVSVKNLQSSVQQALFFDTISDMKAATLNEGDVVRTLGYHSVNDGGAATYLIQYAPAEVDNGITIHYLDTSDTLRAHLVTNGFINPLQAGAYGDGVHNDYSVLNKMIKMKLDIEFPAKDFYIGENLYLKLNSDSKINFGNAILSGTGGIELGLDEACDDIYIENLIMKGTSIRLDSLASYIHINNCKFYSNTGIEIHGATGVYVKDSIFGTKDAPAETPIYMNSGSNIYIGYCSMNFTNIGVNIATYPCESATADNWAKRVSVRACTFNGTGKTKSYGVRMGSVKQISVIDACTVHNADIAVGLNPNAELNLSISDIAMTDCNIGFSTNGGAVAETAKLHLSGLIEFTPADKGDTRSYLFDLGGAYIINDASYKLDGGGGVHVGLARSNNTVYTKDSHSDLGDKLTNGPYGTYNDGFLDLGVWDEKYPAFNMSIVVNSPYGYIKNISTVDCDHLGSVGFKGYTGQIISLYSENRTKLKLNQDNGNIKWDNYNDEMPLNENTPVKLKYNGAYWYVIEY